MTKVTIYDTEAKRIEKIAEDIGVTEAEVVEAIFDIIDNNEIDIKDYL
jgi:hypothetical protein